MTNHENKGRTLTRAARVEEEKDLGQVNANQKHTGDEPTHSAVHRDTHSILDKVPVPKLTCPCPFLLWVIIFSLPTHNTHTRVRHKQWLSFKE